VAILIKSERDLMFFFFFCVFCSYFLYQESVIVNNVNND